MRKLGTKLKGLAVVLVFLGALVTWVVIQPPHRQHAGAPDASVTFLGYTNDAAGARLASFEVTNLSGFAVARSPRCLVCMAIPGGGGTPQSEGLFPGFPRNRGFLAAASRVVTVP